MVREETRVSEVQGGPWAGEGGDTGVRGSEAPGQNHMVLLIVLHDLSDPGHVFADLGIDPWNAFLSTRPNRSPGNQTLKNPSTHQGASRVTLEDRSRQLRQEKAPSHILGEGSTHSSQEEHCNS